MRRLVWFRGKDLRVDDHAPLRDACGAAACVFVLDPFFFSAQRAQRLPNRMAFLLESLAELEATIAGLGGRLLVVAGKSTQVIPALARQLKVDEVVAYRWTEHVLVRTSRRSTRRGTAIRPMRLGFSKGSVSPFPPRLGLVLPRHPPRKPKRLVPLASAGSNRARQ